MFRQYKKHLIFSSLVILLPMVLGLLFWNQLPSLFPSHIGLDGQPDAWQGKVFGVCFLPLTLLAAQWLCLFVTWKDPKNAGRNRKVFRLVMWIMPIISLYSNAILYSTAMGYGINLRMMSVVPLALLFIVIGNYLPKCQQNHTIGIKISWTLANEENWNRTHRFGGKCWMLGGLAMILCVFLPGELGIWVMILAVLLLAVIPMGYSYLIYRKHQKQGIVYPKVPMFGSKKAGRISAVLLTLFLMFVLAVMFTGDITYVFEETGFTVEADFYTDLTVSYDSIDSIEFREGNIPGFRTSGFSSARLLLGFFQNEEFGSYIRYTYTAPDGCIVIQSGSKTLVLSAERYSETLKLYLQLLDAASLS